MPSPSDIARAYLAAQDAHDLDAAVALWAPGAVDRLVGDRDLDVPDGLRAYFAEVFAAFPDFRLEVLELTAEDDRVAARWRVTATFAGPGRANGFLATGRAMTIEGCDVLTVQDGLIVHGDAYVDSGDVARQLGLLPDDGSPTQLRLAGLFNLGTRARHAARAAEPESIADGVWLVRGGFPMRNFNVYLIEGADGVTVFDAGIRGMGTAIRSAAARLGGIERVVLGHADADHRGAAPELGAPIHCHPAERAAAESAAHRRPYFDLGRLKPYARPYFAAMLAMWDGGALPIAGTVSGGEEVAGFRVVELPGHAPGLIALHRESDGVVLCSDAVYTLDPQTGRWGGPRVPHPAFDADLEQAYASIAALADLHPSVVWAGHADPVRGDVGGQLRAAAAGRS